MRILIATTTCGGGHLQAAAALEEAWKKLRPRDAVRRVDVLTYAPSLIRKLYSEGYVRLVERAPELYGRWFRRSDNPAKIRKLTPLRRLAAKWMIGRFLKEAAAFRPDAVLCPHFLPLEALGSLPPEKRPFTACVITDFEAHALWLEPGVDLYCAPNPETRARLATRGVPAGRIAVTGIPVSQRFVGPPSRAAARKALGLDSRVTLLVSSGGFGMGPVAEIARALDRTDMDFQSIIVTGRNEVLRRQLAARRFRHPTRVIGFADNMQTLMAASDLILTKPGGLTTSESLALGLPLLVLNPIPGQEEANSDYLLERGAAVKVNRLEDLPHKLSSCLKPARLAALARGAKALGRPAAAEAVVAAVLKRIRA